MKKILFILQIKLLLLLKDMREKIEWISYNVTFNLSGLNADDHIFHADIITSVHFTYIPKGQKYHYQTLI